MDVLKLLILFPRQLFETKTSPVRRHVIEHLLERNDVETVLSGQGWADYHESKPLCENIERLLPGGCNAVFWYKPLGCKGIRPLKDCNRRGHVPAVATYNEAWWPDRRAWQECLDSKTDLVVCHHLGDMSRFKHGDQWNPKTVHIPHCAKADLFACKSPWRKRKNDIIVTGCISDDIYPVRTRIARMINDGKLPGIVRNHPGYRMPNLAACIAQEREYAAALADSKIAVVCSSKYKYGLAKYFEAAMSGCILLGDIPPELENTLGPLMIRGDASENRIKQRVERVLSHHVESARVSKDTQQIAFARYSVECYCDQFVAAVKRHIEEGDYV